MTTNKHDSNDMANSPPHMETAYVVLLDEEIKMGNWQISTFKKK